LMVIQNIRAFRLWRNPMNIVTVCWVWGDLRLQALKGYSSTSTWHAYWLISNFVETIKRISSLGYRYPSKIIWLSICPIAQVIPRTFMREMLVISIILLSERVGFRNRIWNIGVKRTPATGRVSLLPGSSMIRNSGMMSWKP
jgi:hypothetical protein